MTTRPILPQAPRNDMRNAVVVFCQAPADIKYALGLYEREGGRSFFYFYVVTVEGMAKFLDSLKLKNASVHFLGNPPFSPSLKHLWNNLAIIRWLRSLRSRHLAQFSNARVYYFSNDQDWVTASFVAYLSRRNTVIHISHYPYRCVRVSVNLKERLVMLVYRWLTGACMEWRRVEGADGLSMIHFFRQDRHGIETQAADRNLSGILERFQYELAIPPENAFLVFDGPDEDNLIENFERRLREIIDTLAGSGSRILVKPHPRVPCSRPLSEDSRLEILPAYVPGEFLPLHRFKAVLGIASSALGEAGVQRAGHGVYSFVRLLEWRNPADCDYCEALVRKYARDQITFPGSLDELAALTR
jgi:hypothetical protein